MHVAPLLVGVACLCPAVAQQPQSFSYEQLLGRMTNTDWLWRAPLVGETCVQFSSYDRRSDAGPSDADAWYANDDRGQFLRLEERAGKRHHVMVDAVGPGMLVRLWSANPSGELYFDVDGQRVWTVDFEKLCSGRVDPVAGALAGVHSRGANCYLPIPFRRHLVVSASEGGFYYQCNVVRFPAGTEVPAFSPELLRGHAAAIRAAAADLGHTAVVSETAVVRDRVAVPEGMVVRSFGVRLSGGPEAGPALGELLRRVVLVVRCGDEETVRVPVPDFFCSGADWRPFATRFLRVDGNLAVCAWPMPMPAGGSIALEAEGDLAGLHPRLAGVTLEPLADRDPLLFRASYHQEKGFDSRPFRDYMVLDATGRGRFVGCSLLVKNPTRSWWGEGDEKFYVDGEEFPSTFGTGTEDYFGYAWCCPEPFAAPFHAQTQCDGPGNYGFTALHRSQVLDSVPFQESFRFDLEVWHWVAGLKIDYASVAYWYGEPGAAAGLPPLPAAAARALDRLPPPPVFVAEHAIEGEDLRVVEVSGGRHEVQDLAFRELTFSHDAQRWWRDGKPGDCLVLGVPVEADGDYRVTGAFCMAGDYGVVKLSLAGQPLGPPFDGYAEGIESSGPRELGTVSLRAGEALLRVEIAGKHEKAAPNYMFGLDYLRLQRLP